MSTSNYCPSFVIGLPTCPGRECCRNSGCALVATRRFGYRRNRLSHCPKFAFTAQVPTIPRNRPRDRRQRSRRIGGLNQRLGEPKSVGAEALRKPARMESSITCNKTPYATFTTKMRIVFPSQQTPDKSALSHRLPCPEAWLNTSHQWVGISNMHVAMSLAEAMRLGR